MSDKAKIEEAKRDEQKFSDLLHGLALGEMESENKRLRAMVEFVDTRLLMWVKHVDFDNGMLQYSIDREGAVDCPWTVSNAGGHRLCDETFPKFSDAVNWILNGAQFQGEVL